MTDDEQAGLPGIGHNQPPPLAFAEVKKAAEEADRKAKEEAAALGRELGERYAEIGENVTLLLASLERAPTKIETEKQLEGWEQLLTKAKDEEDLVAVVRRLEKAAHFRRAEAVDAWARGHTSELAKIAVRAKGPMRGYNEMLRQRQRERLEAEAAAQAEQERREAEAKAAEMEAARQKLAAAAPPQETGDDIERIGAARVEAMKAASDEPPPPPRVDEREAAKAAKVEGFARRTIKVLNLVKKSRVPASTIAALITKDELEAMLRRAMKDGGNEAMLGELVKAGAIEIVEDVQLSHRRK